MFKISIVTPSFNQGQFISKTINSVITQNGDFEIEYFVMDGGSTDDTVKILKEYEREIKSGKYVSHNKGVTFYWQSKKDDGQSDAINQGSKKATGDVLAYINSDDTYEEGAFVKVFEAFAQNPQKKWLTGYCNIINQDDIPIRGLIGRYKDFWLRHYSYNRLLILNFISQPATFWKIGAIKEFGLLDDNLHYTMDYEYWLRMGFKSDPIIVDSVLANFRIHDQSKGETAFNKQFDQDFSVSCKYCESSFLRFLHRFHNKLIIIIYRIIK